MAVYICGVVRSCVDVIKKHKCKLGTLTTTYASVTGPVWKYTLKIRPICSNNGLLFYFVQCDS